MGPEDPFAAIIVHITSAASSRTMHPFGRVSPVNLLLFMQLHSPGRCSLMNSQQSS